MTRRCKALLPPPRRWCGSCRLSVGAIVNEIFKKVLNRFYWHFEEVLIMGQGRAEINILVTVQTLTFDHPQIKALITTPPSVLCNLVSPPPMFVPPNSLLQYVRKWAAWRRSALPPCLSGYICNWLDFISHRCANSGCATSILRLSHSAGWQ